MPLDSRRKTPVTLYLCRRAGVRVDISAYHNTTTLSDKTECNHNSECFLFCFHSACIAFAAVVRLFYQIIRAATSPKGGKPVLLVTLPDPCVTHKWQGMTCRYVGGCVTYASFGLPGTKRKIFCSKHKESSMVNISTKRCEIMGCETRATYGDPATRTKQYCAKHKRSEMVSSSKRCKIVGCETTASYGVRGTGTRQYCAKHKRSEMVCLATIRCEIVGCETHATFGVPGTGTRQRCAKHKRSEMVRTNTA